jgi:hypothetical protein
MPRATRAVQEAARRIVRERDGHRCQSCGVSIVDRPSALHHRRRKGMGGSALLEQPANLIRACGNGNADFCHGYMHSNPDHAHDIGWVLWATDDPETTPVLLFDGWFLLSDDGARTPCASPLPYVGEAV